MAVACDVIYLTIVAMETSQTPRGLAYKWSFLYVLNLKWIGWIVSKAEKGGPIDPPPPKGSCNYFFFEASRDNFAQNLCPF